MNEKIFDLKLVTRKDDTIQEIEEGKEAENLKIEIIPISAQVAGKFLTANMIEDTDKKMQELKSMLKSQPKLFSNATINSKSELKGVVK